MPSGERLRKSRDGISLTVQNDDKPIIDIGGVGKWDVENAEPMVLLKLKINTIAGTTASIVLRQRVADGSGYFTRFVALDEGF